MDRGGGRVERGLAGGRDTDILKARRLPFRSAFIRVYPRFEFSKFPAKRERPDPVVVGAAAALGGGFCVGEVHRREHHCDWRQE